MKSWEIYFQSFASESNLTSLPLITLSLGARALNIISNDQFTRFRIWVNGNEKHKKEIGFGEYKGTEHSSRFKQLLYRAIAEEIISMSEVASLSNVKLAQFRDEFMAI